MGFFLLQSLRPIDISDLVGSEDAMRRTAVRRACLSCVPNSDIVEPNLSSWYSMNVQCSRRVLQKWFEQLTSSAIVGEAKVCSISAVRSLGSKVDSASSAPSPVILSLPLTPARTSLEASLKGYDPRSRWWTRYGKLIRPSLRLPEKGAVWAFQPGSLWRRHDMVYLT